MPQTEQETQQVSTPSSPKLETCLSLLRKINWARRVGKRELADKLLYQLWKLEGKKWVL